MLSFTLIVNIFKFLSYTAISFSLFSIALLYFDAWQIRKKIKTPLIRSIGFAFLSVTLFAQIFSGVPSLVVIILEFIKNFSLALILLSLIAEPILNKPSNLIIPPTFGLLNFLFIPVSAILHFSIFVIYLIKSEKGLEKQLAPAGFGFIFLGLSESIRYAGLLVSKDNVVLERLFSDFGLFNILSLVFLLTGAIILGAWSWGYIRFRLQIQLFVSTLASVLLIFVVTTSVFTYILLKGIETETLSALETNGRVFQYAIERIQFEAVSNSRTVANDPNIKQLTSDKARQKLFELVNDYLVDQNASVLNITDADGVVLAKAEDQEQIGMSMKGNPLIESALSDSGRADLSLVEGVLVNQLQVNASYPINLDGELVGSVLSGFIIDNAFLDGVKSVTDLDISIYAQDVRAATTLLAPDGISRYVGSKETNESVLKSIFEDQKPYLGTSQILNQPYYTTYIPLRNTEDEVIGMLFAGKPQVEILETAQSSVNSTFLGSGILMLISIIPVYFFSKFIRENIEA